jgi:hypothetical protein
MTGFPTEGHHRRCLKKRAAATTALSKDTSSSNDCIVQRNGQQQWLHSQEGRCPEIDPFGVLGGRFQAEQDRQTG